MKWTKKELINLIDVHFNEEISFDKAIFKKWDRLNDLRNVTVKGKGHYDCSLQRFEIDLDLAGEMIVPCAVTLEDVSVMFEFSSTEVFSFITTEEEDVHECKKELLELYPVIFQLILNDVPIKVVKEDAEYLKGDGWEVMSEAEYRNRKEQEVDPRLAKLKDFKFDES